MEHRPPPVFVAMMFAFVWAVAAFALAFWLLSILWPGGAGGLIASLGPSTGALFVTAHIPAAIAGLLLLQWGRAAMAPRPRVLLEAATVYFGGSVAVMLLGNFAAMVALENLL